MKKIIIIGMAVIMAAAGASCAKQEKYDVAKRKAINDNEIQYNFSNTETYKNSFEIDGQWGSNSSTGADGKYGIGDPFVMRFNGKYYLYPSTSDNFTGVKVFESDDLINWDYKGFAVSEIEETTKTAYAPEVIYYNGYFYMCQSQGGKGHYVYKSHSPLGPFERITDNIGKGIDGSFYLSDENKLYILHTSSSAALMYTDITDIENAGSYLPSSRYVENANLNHWIEGPSVFRRGKYSYLTYTGNHVCSSGYRVAYSYAENINSLQNFIQPENNVTLISTEDDFKGLGHSSNVIGCNLDSIYTAYHNLVGNGPARRLNIDRYFTNGGYLTANGITNYPVAVPQAADYCAENSEGLINIDSINLSQKATSNNYTVELNFSAEKGGAVFSYKDENNYYYIEYNSEKRNVILYKKANGIINKLSQFYLSENSNPLAIQTIRIESGFDKSYVYFNNMRKVTFDENFGGGKIGYLENTQGFYTAFTNDVFGTSDFEAVKNLPSAFPATDYLKTENRGFFIDGAKVDNNGTRQGEKESTKYIENEQAYSLILGKRDDYVKYAVNASDTSNYMLTARINKNSAGAFIEVIIDNDIYPVIIPDFNTESGNEYSNIILGNFDMTEGNHTVKIRLYSGTLDVMNWQFFGGKETKDFNDTMTETSENFYVKSGIFSYEKGLVSSDNGINVLLSDKSVNQNYTISCDVGYLNDSSSGSGGIVFRMDNYSYYSAQPQQSFQGYYLEIKKSLIILNKYNYGEKKLGYKVAEDSEKEGLFSAGNTNNLKIAVKNNLITIYLNGEKNFEVYDDKAFLYGSFGIYTNNANMKFKNFSYSEEL